MGQIVTKDEAFKRLRLLVNRFLNDLERGEISGSNPKTLKRFPITSNGKKFSESQVRQSYVLPLFRDVLGWDICHKGIKASFFLIKIVKLISIGIHLR